MTVLGKLVRATREPSILASETQAASIFSTPAAVTAKGQELIATPEKVLHHPTAYACMKLIAEDVGGLPVDLVRSVGRWRYSAFDHPLLPFLAEQPNEEMDAAEMWRQVVGWMGARGNGYIYLDWDRRTGEVLGLWPVPASRVFPARDTQKRLMYLLQLQQWDRVADIEPLEMLGVPAENMLHFRSFGLGLVGLSPCQQMADSIALGMNAEEYGARFFEQNGIPGGAIKVPTNLTDEQWEILNARWQKLHTGQAKAHVTAILEGGADWVPAGINNQEMQFIELRNFQVEEVARIFGVPPHMIGHTVKSTSWGTGIEQQHIGYILHTLMPYISRIERVVKARIFPSQRDIRMRFNVNGMLRGDTAARYSAYAIGRQWGWLSQNDIRALEDLPPITGGDTYLSPLNMGAVNKQGLVTLPVDPSTDANGDPVDDQAARARLVRLLSDLQVLTPAGIELPASMPALSSAE